MFANVAHLAVAAAAEVDARERFAYLDVEPWHWFALLGFIVTLVVVDLLLVHRTAHVITIKEASIESAVWISIGVAFTGVIYLLGADGDQGKAATEYLSGFLIEKSLSIDNVFVWAVIFSFFAVPREYQFRVLFWGIFGALVLRAGFIVAGTALIEQFDWVLYVFGAFLLYTAWKIAHHDETEVVDYNQNLAMRAVRRLVPTTTRYDGQRLFTIENAKRVATPLFAVLVLIEATDVVFAVDSVPRSSRSAARSSSCSAPTRSPSSGSARSSSSSAAWPASSATSTSASASSSPTSGPRCSSSVHQSNGTPRPTCPSSSSASS